jgi:periplasmic protein CpxP/Spy
MLSFKGNPAMHNKKIFTALLAAGLIGVGGPAHAFGLGLLAAGVASIFDWGSSDGAGEGDGEKSGPMGMGGMMRGLMNGGAKDDPATRTDQRLARIRSEVNPTAEQEPLWNDFAEKTRAETAAGKMVRELRGKARDENLGAPAYLERSQAAMRDQLAAHAATADSFRLFYAVLTPEQRLVADRHLVGLGANGRGGAPAAQSGQPGSGVAGSSDSAGEG